MRLFFGSDSGALEGRCLAEVHQRTLDFPDQRAFLIVPEQNKVQMERSYLDMTGAEGLLMAEVLSFRRLAHRLLDETGLLPGRRIDEFGRRMLLFRVLKENSSQLHSFAHLADRSGFIAEAESVIGDLKRHRISPDQLRQIAESDAEKALADKCHDLSVLLAGYDQALAGQMLFDSDDDLNRLADLLEKLASAPRGPDGLLPFPFSRLFPLEKTHVLISGFGFTRDFTPQEYRILDQLSHLCASLTVTIQADAWPTSDAAAEWGPDQFLIGRRTLRRLTGRAWTIESVQVEPGRTDLQNRAADLLTRLPVSLPAAPVQATQDADEGPLTLIRLNTATDEIDWIAGEIRRLTQTGRYRYQDIAIALCDPATALPLLRSAARRYQLPFFLDDARSLAGTALLRYMMGLLDLALRNWSRDAVMTVLRSGLTPLSPAEIDLLENDLLQRGLFRKDRLFSFAGAAAGNGQSPSASDKRIRQAVTTVFMPMRDLTDDLHRAPATAHCCRRIRRYFEEQGLVERISAGVDRLKEQNEPDAALLSASAHTVLGQVLQQLETIAGDIPMSLTQLRDTIRSGLAGASIVLIPSALDQIMVGDWRRISRQPCRVLFVVGARLDALPPRPAPEGILKDLDRQHLSEMLQIRLPSNARDQAFADDGSLFQLLTRASDRLYLGSSGGEPAEIATRMESAFPGCRVISTDDRSDLFNPRMNALPAAWHRTALLSGAAVRLSANRAAGWRELVRLIAADPEFAASPPFSACRIPEPAIQTTAAVDAMAGTVCLLPGFISPEIVRQLYAPLPSMSVSQLETYAACPFSHLANTILRLQERAVYAPEATDTGTLLHSVVELAIRDLSDQLTAAGADKDALNAVLRRFAEGISPDFCQLLMVQAIARNGLEALNRPGIRSGTGRKLNRIARSSLAAIVGQLDAGRFLPRYLEWSFGTGQDATYTIDLPDGQPLSLRGLVDRVDQCVIDGQALFRIIDYKSGNKKVDPDTLYHGLALQLPAYLSAFSANHPEAVADEAAYFHFDWPVIRPGKAGEDPATVMQSIRKQFELRKTGLNQSELELLQRHTRRRMGTLSGQLFSGQFPVYPRKIRGGEAACRYCPYSALCGFNRRDFCILNPVGKLLQNPEKRLTRMQTLCRLMAAESSQEES